MRGGLLQFRKLRLLESKNPIYIYIYRERERDGINVPTTAPPQTSKVPHVPTPGRNTGGVVRDHWFVQAPKVPATRPPPEDTRAPTMM